MTRVLITGTTGFLGSRAYQYLAQNCEVRAVPSALLRGEMNPARTEQLYALMAAFEPHVLLHTAAISDMGYAQEHPDESQQANLMLPLALARGAAKLGCKMIFCSSDQVYNGCGGEGPFVESTPLVPANTYAKHKLEAEQRLRDVAPDTVSLRLTWMYDLPGYGLPTHRNLMTNLLQAAACRQPLSLFTADYRGITYVRQVVELLPLAFDLQGGAYNFGSESTQNVWQIASAWCEALGLDPALLLPVAGTRRSLCMDCAKIAQSGIRFDGSAEGVHRCIRDYGLEQLLCPAPPQNMASK